ncbi:MAG: DUF3604 domain-containing protein [Porticoccaceae bacterium]|jgi:hypothetical protein|nr:DUF3604 domain-containing protein [Porticoccaceae bacterium]
MKALTFTAAFCLSASCLAESTEPAKTQVYFGDTHLHTSYSFDAFLNNNFSADPDTAYRWAKGQPVIHPYNRARVQINTPLDFLVVSDHAEMLGVMRAIREDTIEWEDIGWYDSLKRWWAVRLLNNALDDDLGRAFFGRFLPKSAAVVGGDPVADVHNNIGSVAIFGDTTGTSKDAWLDIIDAAEKYNEPGVFTSLLGWEWSSLPTGANLHRIVVTPDGGDKASQYIPYGSDQSQYPEDLWQWLEDTEASTDSRFISIPHNSNISKGYMFGETTVKGEAITADYARTRMQWEPITEVTQIKGDSETHPGFSPEDEFADFETYDYYIQTSKSKTPVSLGDYIRPALKRGLAIEQKVGANPYKFGFIGSTDAHSGLSSPEEGNFWGKMAKDSTPETKAPTLGNPTGADGWDMSASGLAAVWATENNREAIYAAFKRKETYATTGPRMRVQLFAGWDFPAKAESSENFAAIGYQHGVPMGGDLTANPSAAAPKFMVRAVKGPLDANLDRVQMVKGWVDASGEQHEMVYNIVWSGDRVLDANGKLPAVGNTVDLKSARYTNSIGQAEFATKWSDPDFDPAQLAFYYARVLQIPTPRNGLFDSLALRWDEPPKGPKTIQERAYTSPVWYTP